ncbi:MAG TPA: hypothetical protein VK629_19840 [Steroidobacteraceae bacterium]|nr:hypothetical protein [Steroidobacteraceae bacterium]
MRRHALPVTLLIALPMLLMAAATLGSLSADAARGIHAAFAMTSGSALHCHAMLGATHCAKRKPSIDKRFQ